MQSVRGLVDFTLEDNMVDGLFFCVTAHKRPYPTVQAWAEASDTMAEEVKPNLGCSWEGHSKGVGAGDETEESCRIVWPLNIPLVIRPVHRMYVVVR